MKVIYQPECPLLHKVTGLDALVINLDKIHLDMVDNELSPDNVKLEATMIVEEGEKTTRYVITFTSDGFNRRGILKASTARRYENGDQEISGCNYRIKIIKEE